MRHDRRQARRRGLLAERLAALWLALKGYRILGRNLDLGVGEIDLLARRGNVLVVVEVKRRDSLAQGIEAVSALQQARLGRAASALLSRRPDLRSLDLRFDLIVVGGLRRPRHLADAWRPWG